MGEHLANYAMRSIVAWRTAVASAGQRLRDERGEGVISVALAVLIIAGIGVLVWAGFQTFWETTESKTNSNISQIGG
jgi:hypothetical protein